MQTQFKKISFADRVKSMLKVDFMRMFKTPLVYIMAGVCLVIPILILVMTTLLPSTSVDPETGVEKTAETFTNVWQAISPLSSAGQSMDLTGMCNINMIFFLIPVMLCIFVADDFRSGYAKNLFAVRAKKTDYVISKSAVGFVGGAIMVIAYFIGAMLGGAIAGLPFDTGEAGAGGIVACMLSKIFLVAIFVAIALTLGVVGKQRLWLSVLGSLAACMLLFTMLPMISPLDSDFLNVIMCIGGAALFLFGFGAVSNLILNKTNLA